MGAHPIEISRLTPSAIGALGSKTAHLVFPLLRKNVVVQVVMLLSDLCSPRNLVGDAVQLFLLFSLIIVQFVLEIRCMCTFNFIEHFDFLLQ